METKTNQSPENGQPGSLALNASSASDGIYALAIVRGLRAEIKTLERYKKRMEWLHDCSTGCKDAEGFEWGIYRVKWENGQAVAVWQTNSDFSDLDAQMAREASSPNIKT